MVEQMIENNELYESENVQKILTFFEENRGKWFLRDSIVKILGIKRTTVWDNIQYINSRKLGKIESKQKSLGKRGRPQVLFSMLYEEE